MARKNRGLQLDAALAQKRIVARLAVAGAMTRGATVGGWIASGNRVRALAGGATGGLFDRTRDPAESTPEACLAAGEHLLDGLLNSGSTSRGSALDLLAVDALVTYAFQAAADAPDRLEARAAHAMARIASITGDRPV